MPKAGSGRSRTNRLLGEFGGAFGDLGTLLPLALGAITVAGLAAGGVLLGFGVALVGAGLFYGLPMPVQPMKAIAAVILTAVSARARWPPPASSPASPCSCSA